MYPLLSPATNSIPFQLHCAVLVKIPATIKFSHFISEMSFSHKFSKPKYHSRSRKNLVHYIIIHLFKSWSSFCSRFIYFLFTFNNNLWLSQPLNTSFQLEFLTFSVILYNLFTYFNIYEIYLSCKFSIFISHSLTQK